MASAELGLRGFWRHPGSAQAVVTPDADMSGCGIVGTLLDISSNGVGLRLPQALGVGEPVTIELANPLERCQVRLRGSVRYAEPLADRHFRVGCSLLTHLSPRTVVALSPIRP